MIGQIKRQAGIVYLLHPLDEFGPSLAPDMIDRIVPCSDALEVFNGCSAADANRRAEQLCTTLGALAGTGSDAPSVHELGHASVEMDPFTGPADFLAMVLLLGVMVIGPMRKEVPASRDVNGQQGASHHRPDSHTSRHCGGGGYSGYVTFGFCMQAAGMTVVWIEKLQLHDEPRGSSHASRKAYGALRTVSRSVSHRARQGTA